MINASDRRQAVELIKEAVDSGAAMHKACTELGISKRTYNRWKNTDSDYIDKRTICARSEPANKLTKEERQEILDICNTEEFASKTPRLWVKRFVKWYNNEHRHSGINYVTPSQRYKGLDQEVLRKRKEVYEKAKERHPERWAKVTRAWSFSEEEWLNPRQEAETKKRRKSRKIKRKENRVG